FWFEHGWFWFIPLSDGTTSIGVVMWPHYLKTRQKPVREFFLDQIALCPQLAMRLKDAELVSEVDATGNFSYSCDRSHGDNYLLLGDAYAFVDPVFSSGVMLAMKSAFVGADAIDTSLRQPDKMASALKQFDKVVKHGPREFSWFIYRVTNPTMRDLFMAPSNIFRVQEALLSVLAGDIYGKTPIWGSLRMLKVIYYLTSIANLKRTLMAWKRRKQNIRFVEEPEGTA
ncbi:MAG: tryptophan 7-halogenase, partial [Thiobacillus sp.]|nr:tryptophan 7-halogenase [Thiobacillus sp.]